MDAFVSAGCAPAHPYPFSTTGRHVPLLQRFLFIYLCIGKFVFELQFHPGVVVYWFEVRGDFICEVGVDAVGGEFFG